MKKSKKSSVSKKRAVKKGHKKVKRAKIAKRHIETRNELIEALKKQREKEYMDYYNNLMGGQ